MMTITYQLMFLSLVKVDKQVMMAITYQLCFGEKREGIDHAQNQVETATEVEG